MNHAPFVGVDIGGTNLRVALGRPGDQSSQRCDQSEVPRSYREMVDAIADMVGRLCDQAGTRARPVGCVGVGVPGTVRDGVATFVPALRFLDGQPLGRDLTKRLGVPVVLGNDAECALLAEARMGAAAGRRHVALVVVGTGIGGAMLVDGRPYRGRVGAAGAFGWLPVAGDPDARHGAWERAASGQALAKLAAAQGLSPDDLMSSAARGDERSTRVVDTYARELGRGLAAIASVWDPEVIVLGGVVSPYLAQLNPGIDGAFADWASPAGRQVPRVAATLGRRAGVLGALCMADGWAGGPR